MSFWSCKSVQKCSGIYFLYSTISVLWKMKILEVFLGRKLRVATRKQFFGSGGGFFWRYKFFFSQKSLVLVPRTSPEVDSSIEFYTPPSYKQGSCRERMGRQSYRILNETLSSGLFSWIYHEVLKNSLTVPLRSSHQLPL